MDRVSKAPTTNVLGTLLEAYDFMEESERILVPPIGWSCAKIDYVAKMGYDGCIELEEFDDSDSHYKFWNDSELQPVPLQGKKDVLQRWMHQTYFGCTSLEHLVPKINKKGNVECAAAYALYKDVFEHVDSDIVRNNIAFILDALRDPSLWDVKLTSKNKKKSVCFLVETRERGKSSKYVYLHKIPEVIEAWNKFYANMICELKEVKGFDDKYVDTSNGIRGDVIHSQVHAGSFLVNEQNCPILSVSNTVSFNSYGFSGLEHGSISFETDAKLCAVIDWLNNSGRFVSLDRSNGRKTKLVFWGDNVEHNLVENIKSLLKVDKNEAVNVDNLLKERSYLKIMELRPNIARMSVHQIDEYKIHELAERRLQVEQNMKLVGIDSFNVGASLYYWDEFDGYKCCGKTCYSLLRSMVFGEPWSLDVLSSLVRIVERDSSLFVSDDSIFSMGRRAALMKLYLIEACNVMIGEELMEDNNNSMYKLGRMIAVCDKAQREAVGVSSMRKRFVSAAVSMPRSTAVDVFEAYTLYSSLLSSKNYGKFVYLDKIWCTLMSNGENINDMFPQFVSSEDKLQLYLGYYQQMSDFFKKRSAVDVNDLDTDNIEE